jgi:hypothetical protein
MATPPITHIARLHTTIVSAGVAITGVGSNALVTPAALQAAAQPTINAFDDSPAAQLAFENTQARSLAAGDIEANKGPLYKLLRALAAVIIDEINPLRAVVIGAASQTWDPANMTNATGLTSPNFTVNGAAFGDVVDPVAPYTLAGITATAYVSAANTANIRLHNGTGGAVNLASGTWAVIVRRHGVLAPRTLAQAKTAIQNQVNAGNVD